jgi:hypothetical protein
MKFFKALVKLIGRLTNQKSLLGYVHPQIEEESPTEEESVMEVEPVIVIRDWAIKKIDLLHEADRHKNAKALAAEFDEWINLPEDSDELTYYCLEDLNDRQPNT